MFTTNAPIQALSGYGHYAIKTPAKRLPAAPSGLKMGRGFGPATIVDLSPEAVAAMQGSKASIARR